MTSSRPTERIVEDVSAVYFGHASYRIERGVDLDDSGGRTNISAVVLVNRVATLLRQSQPAPPCRDDRRRRRHSLPSASPDADREQSVVPRPADRRRTGGVQGRQDQRDPRRAGAANRLREPNQQRLPRRPPAHHPGNEREDDPAGPGAVRQRPAAGRDRTEGPGRPGRRPEPGDRPVRAIQDDRARPVRAEPAARGQRRTADARRKHHQRSAAVHARGVRPAAASRRWKR